MAKEFSFEGLDPAAEGVNLEKANKLISDLTEMGKRGVSIDKATLKELQEEMQVLMDLQTSFGKSAPKKIGFALAQLRNLHNTYMEGETV
jgi:hypothetical protein